VLTSNVSRPFVLFASDIQASEDINYWVHDWTQPQLEPQICAKPLAFKVPSSEASNDGTSPFNLFTFSPTPVLGERDKIVSVSKARFIEIGQFSIKINVCSLESVKISVVGVNDIVYTNQKNFSVVVDIKLPI